MGLYWGTVWVAGGKDETLQSAVVIEAAETQTLILEDISATYHPWPNCCCASLHLNFTFFVLKQRCSLNLQWHWVQLDCFGLFQSQLRLPNSQLLVFFDCFCCFSFVTLVLEHAHIHNSHIVFTADLLSAGFHLLFSFTFFYFSSLLLVFFFLTSCFIFLGGDLFQSLDCGRVV